MDECVWEQSKDWDLCDMWSSACGNEWLFEDGGPNENMMKFCCYCGKPLHPVPAPSDLDDQEGEVDFVGSTPSGGEKHG